MYESVDGVGKVVQHSTTNSLWLVPNAESLERLLALRAQIVAPQNIYTHIHVTIYICIYIYVYIYIYVNVCI